MWIWRLEDYAVNVRPFRIRAVPPTPSEQILVNTFLCVIPKIPATRSAVFSEKMFGWFLSLIWPRFCIVLKGGEYRETHNTLVCWSGWTNCWKSKNSQQIFLADNFSGAEWVSLSSYQVFLHDMHLNICILVVVLVGLHVGLKGCAELVGHRAVNSLRNRALLRAWKTFDSK